MSNIEVLHDTVTHSPLRGEYTPIQVTTQQQVDRFWPQIEQYLKPCVDKALHGEYLMSDIYRMVCEMRVVLFVVTDDPAGETLDPHVSLALVAEPVIYPRLYALNILAMGGQNLTAHKRFWGHFKSWAFMNGARAIEASVSPAMMRILSHWGFENVYSVARCQITEHAL